MRQIITLSILIILSSCQDKTPNNPEKQNNVLQDVNFCNCDDLILDTGFNWYYLSDRIKPFTGKCSKTLPNGNILLERNYEKGKVHGNVKEWHENGQLKLSMHFNMNMQEGEMKEWDSEGTLEYRASYTFGKMDSLIYKRIHYVNQ